MFNKMIKNVWISHYLSIYRLYRAEIGQEEFEKALLQETLASEEDLEALQGGGWLLVTETLGATVKIYGFR